MRTPARRGATPTNGNGSADSHGDAYEGPEAGDAQPAESIAPEFPDPIPCSKLRAASDDTRWIWHGYIAENATTLFSALWKAGKTTLLAHLMRSLEHGGTFCGHTVRPTNVLYVAEEHESRWARRRDKLGLGDNIDFLTRPFKAKPNLAKWERFIAHLQRKLDAKPYGLVVFDTISNLWPVRDENDPVQVQECMMPLQSIITERAAFMPVHHFRKGDGQEATAARGSGALPALVDTIVELRRSDPSDRASRRRVLTGYGRDDDTPGELVIELDEQTGEYVAVGDRHTIARAEVQEVLIRILPRCKPGFKFDEIKAAWGDGFPTKSTLIDALNEGIDSAKWTRDGYGRKSSPFTYWVQNG